MRLLSRALTFTLIFLIFIGGIISSMYLEINENLEATLPNQKEFSVIQSWMDKQKNIIVFSLDLSPDSPSGLDIETLSDSLESIILSADLIGDLQYKNDIETDEFVKLITHSLPIYLDQTDYEKLDSLTKPELIKNSLIQTKKTLFSPEGIGQRTRILQDPLGFSSLAFKNFSKMDMTQDIIKNGGYFLTPDGQTLLLKGRLNFDVNNSESNRQATETFDRLVTSWNSNMPDHQLNYFGTFLIADVNAQQIQKDVQITVTVAVTAIVLLLIYYYRRFIILILFLVPGIFGILAAVLVIYLLQGQISGLALASSAIVFGIVADYSFHFFTHFKEKRNAIESRNDIMFPLLVSGGTTIVAFLSLFFADSKALKDFGLFTSLSLSGTLFFILTGLPLILRIFEKSIHFPKLNHLDKWVNKIKIGRSTPNNISMALFVLLSLVMFYFGKDVQFESDLRKINYYPEDLQQREIALQNINPEIEQRITLLSRSAKGHSAEWTNHKVNELLQNMQSDHQVKEFFSIAPIMISKELQEERIETWNHFWKSRRDDFLTEFKVAADEQGWKLKYFDSFFELIEKEHRPIDLNEFVDSSKNLKDLKIQGDHSYDIITTLICPKENVPMLKETLSSIPGTVLVDNSSIMAKIVDSVKADFNFLLLYAALAVFIAFLFIYGNMELTLVSFIPMVLSWVWVLGIASILGIKFNFINIIITTFIFGLGDDFSIFVTDGLLHRYKYKKEVIGQYKTGIILSSISTIIGTGVLIFAKHPALQSIALLSVLGIVIIVGITFFIQPVLFRLLISNRTEIGKPPYTTGNALISFWGYGMFVLGCMISLMLSFCLRVLPLRAEYKKRGTHKIIQLVAGLQLDVLWRAKKKYLGMENLDFSKPSILITNHSSFFDILAMVRLSPKLVVIVKEWVYYSPLFGPTIRYADYIPSFQNMEDQIPKIKKLVSEGYSIVIYPEGKRSEDGKIGRFHKGAFYLADELNLDITPIMLHGYNYVMPKNEYYFKDSYCDTVVLPRIKSGDQSFGTGYRERTKKISTYFKAEYQKFEESEIRMPQAYAPLKYSYLYKSPILIWYFRIKWKFEKHHYEKYHSLIGSGSKKIYDLGCGYGYLTYFLWLRNNKRTVLGFDYDEEKVELSQNSYLKTDKVNFECAAVQDVDIREADTIILADVLHYLNPEDQLKTLENCDQGLKAEGLLLIRDGVVDLKSKHKWTEKSEKWSTQLIKFNKTSGKLHFLNRSFIENWAIKKSYKLEVDNQSEKSSNILFILRKNIQGQEEIKA